MRTVFSDALRQGIPVLALLIALDALIVPAAIGIHSLAPQPATPATPIPWLAPDYVVGQTLLHVLTGFVVGLLAMSFSKALIGAAMGPLIDIDHLAALAGFPSAARYGHSIILLACLVLLVWLLGLWRWGAPDFALFSTAQLSAHFAVAPPGFPLLSPIVTTSFNPPLSILVLVTALCLLPAWLHEFRSRR